MRTHHLLIVTACAAAAAGAVAQQRSFEVASIKRTVDVTGGPSFSLGPGGRLHVVNNPLLNVIANAYNLPAYRVADAPGWVTSDRYDIEARADGDASRDEMISMLQALLQDRFKLRARRESREGAIYVLKVARGGHKLHASQDGGCGPFDPRNRPSPAQPRRPICGNNLTFDRGAMTAWRATRINMADAADLLSREVRRPVRDQTGLDGFFDISVDLPALNPTTPIGDDANTAAANGPSFFTVLREQLGLTLEPARGPIDMLVIDRIERPTDN